jgi:hypothetical protein
MREGAPLLVGARGFLLVFSEQLDVAPQGDGGQEIFGLADLPAKKFRAEAQ